MTSQDTSQSSKALEVIVRGLCAQPAGLAATLQLGTQTRKVTAMALQL